MTVTMMDAAGRLVIPKSIREAMRLQPGTPIDVTFSDGRIEIDFAPVEAAVDTSGALPRVVAQGHVASLTDDDVRTAIEATRT